MNVYLCGITQNKKDKIDGLTKDVYSHFDGLIFVDGGSTDGSLELLESRKGKGKIIHRSWTNDFDFQNNEILRQGPMKVGDWFLLRDDEERLNPDFTKNIKSFVQDLDNNRISSCWWLGKGFLFKYYDDMYFQGNPHWGIVNNRERRIDLAQYFGHTDDNKEITWNTRLGNRTQQDMYKHHLKYYWVYGRSNHLLLGRENNIKEYQELESNRLNFRQYCAFKYNLDYTIESLHNFLLTNKWENDKIFTDMFNKEPILQKYYLSFIRNVPVEQIAEKWGIST
jgi:glycosyltransferase involved in cell wall biosynthesis